MNDKLKEKVLSNEQLADVAGGGFIDRTIMGIWVDHYYGSNGTHGNVVDISKRDSESFARAFESLCDKAGLEYKKNETGVDMVKINGEFRDFTWLNANKQETLAFLDAKLGIK